MTIRHASTSEQSKVINWLVVALYLYSVAIPYINQCIYIRPDHQKPHARGKVIMLDLLFQHYASIL